jgi:hypothetical protein
VINENGEGALQGTSVTQAFTGNQDGCPRPVGTDAEEALGFVKDDRPIAETGETDPRLREVFFTFIKEVLGVDDRGSLIDAGVMSGSLTPETVRRLSSFMEYVLDAPRTPLRLKHFSYHYEARLRPGECPVRSGRGACRRAEGAFFLMNG